MMITKTPFHNSNDEICFSWLPVSDRVFIYRLPTPQKFDPKGTLLIPDILKEQFQPEVGILLAVGPGFYGEKGKYHVVSKDLKPGMLVSFDPQVPWSISAKGVDGKFHKVVVCGEKDILGIVLGE